MLIPKSYALFYFHSSLDSTQAGLAEYCQQNEIVVESSWYLLGGGSRHIQKVLAQEFRQWCMPRLGWGEGSEEARLVFAFVARGPSGHARRGGLGGAVLPLRRWWKIRQVTRPELSQFPVFLFSIFKMKSRWRGEHVGSLVSALLISKNWIVWKD